MKFKKKKTVLDGNLLFVDLFLDKVDADCINNNLTSVKDGMSYSPEGTDDCTTCLCKDSEPMYCSVLECTLPSKEVSALACDFILHRKA